MTNNSGVDLSALKGEQIAALSQLYLVHIDTLFGWVDKLTYGIYALTFAFYLALFSTTGLHASIHWIYTNRPFWFWAAMAVISILNFAWAGLGYRLSLRLNDLSKKFENLMLNGNYIFTQELTPSLLYLTAPPTLIMANWLVWFGLVIIICQKPP